MSRRKFIKKDIKKFRAFEVRDWLQENRLNKKMCKWCGDNPPDLDGDYCSETCAKNRLVWQFSE